MRILFLGDIVGKPGREAVKKKAVELRQRLHADLVIANGENAAGGVGIDPGTANEIFSAGIEVITTGNHVWSKKEVYPYLDQHKTTIIRPANFQPGTPGAGATIFRAANGVEVGVVNILGRVFMPDLVDCPFRAIDGILGGELSKVKIIFVDFHAEATSEKAAFAYHVDGRVSVVVGTHTHVATADERVLPKGTAFISDVGMCGPRESIIGVQTDLVLTRFTTGMPIRFETAKGPAMVNGVLVEVDPGTGRAASITRVAEDA